MRSFNLVSASSLAVAAAGLPQPSDPGYSGSKSRPHERPSYVRSSHLTAKTHRNVPCLSTVTAVASIRDRAERLQMLKERRA